MARVTEDRVPPLVQAAIITVITIIVLFARRPDQFLHPYIWVEDGRNVLKEFAEQGAWTLTIPLAGYFLTASKLISVIAYKLSILWAPEIELFLVVAFTCAVSVAVALSPTHLRWPFFCAIAVLLVPSDAEVFAVSAYAFWWAGILLLLAVLWDTDRGREWLRWLYILVGGLSSPIIGPIVVLLAFRAVVERRKSEIFACAVAAIVAVVQLMGMHTQGLHIKFEAIGLIMLPLIIQTYIGNFIYAEHGYYIGYVFVVLLIIAIWLVRSRLDRYFFFLVITFLVISFTIILRHGVYAVELFHPIRIAPRYYFYPFILLSWIMIWVAAVSSSLVRLAIGASFACALFAAQIVLVAGNGLSRRHDPIDWRLHITKCAESAEYEVPIHYIGHANDTWYARLTGEECKSLLDGSIF